MATRDLSSAPVPGGKVTSQSSHLEVSAHSAVMFFEEGLYAITFGKTEVPADPNFGIGLPAVLVSTPPTSDYDPVHIIANSGEDGDWIGAEGGTLVIKASVGGGVILVTTFSELTPSEIITNLRRLDVPATPTANRRTPQRKTPSAQLDRGAPPRATAIDVRREVVLHVEMRGDCRYTTADWLGEPGSRLRIEGFSIRPLEQLPPNQIEYKAFGPNGRETPRWGSACDPPPVIGVIAPVPMSA